MLKKEKANKMKFYYKKRMKKNREDMLCYQNSKWKLKMKCKGKKKWMSEE